MVISLLLLLAVLVQEAALGLRLVLPMLLALGLNSDLKRLLSFSFAAGIIVDLVAGVRLGFSALIYMAAAVLTLRLFKYLRNSQSWLVSLVVAVMVIIELLFKQFQVNWRQVLAALVIFWLTYPVFFWLESKRRVGGLIRLKA